MTCFKPSLRSSTLVSLLAIAVALAACDTRRIDRGDDDDDDDDDASHQSGGDDTSTNSEPGGPELLSLITSPNRISEHENVTITATVSDPDGLQDVVGGLLKTADGTGVYGPFVQLSNGTYSIPLSWDMIDQIEPINFASELQRTFVAEFSDTTQKVGSHTVELTLSCDGYAACDGDCADEYNPYNCMNCDPAARCCDALQYGSSDQNVLCEPERAKLDAIIDCVCASPCAGDCQSLCQGGESDSYCQECVYYLGSGVCQAEVNACCQ